jgi:hypothetical protein
LATGCTVCREGGSVRCRLFRYSAHRCLWRILPPSERRTVGILHCTWSLSRPCRPSNFWWHGIIPPGPLTKSSVSSVLQSLDDHSRMRSLTSPSLVKETRINSESDAPTGSPSQSESRTSEALSHSCPRLRPSSGRVSVSPPSDSRSFSYPILRPSLRLISHAVMNQSVRRQPFALPPLQCRPHALGLRRGLGYRAGRGVSWPLCA